MNNLELLDLRVFCCVARLSSFIASAHELGISPAYVSKRIADLERRLEVTLFHRTTRRVQLSEPGERAYARARKILEDVHDLANAMSSGKSEPSGPLRISTSLRLGRNHVAPILSRLGREFPKLDIWLELINSRIDLIAERIDVEIRVGEITEPHLIAQRLVKSERILCAAPGYLARNGTPATLADLARHECLLFRGRDQAFGVWRLEGPDGKESIKVSSRFGSNHSDIVRGWVLDGYGIIMLSDWDVADELERGSLVRVLPTHAQSADIWAATPARLASTAKIRLAIEFLTEGLRAGPHALHALH